MTKKITPEVRARKEAEKRDPADVKRHAETMVPHLERILHGEREKYLTCLHDAQQFLRSTKTKDVHERTASLKHAQGIQGVALAYVEQLNHHLKTLGKESQHLSHFWPNLPLFPHVKPVHLEGKIKEQIEYPERTVARAAAKLNERYAHLHKKENPMPNLLNKMNAKLQADAKKNQSKPARGRKRPHHP